MDPWQDWLLLHAGELLPDGRPRFKTVLVLVARQNGKTHVLVALALWWTFVDALPMILGTSTKLDYAKESWFKAVELAERAPGLKGLVPARRRSWVRLANGEQEYTINGSRYKIAPANEEGGRSLSIDALIMDELRQHHDRSAWGAAVPATNARPYAQAWALSNMGDDRSEVLNTERAARLRYITTGAGNPRAGLFEWSAPERCPLDDPAALAMANPNLGRRILLEDLLGDAATAATEGGDTEASYRTEVLCQRVARLDPAIDAGAWGACGPGDYPPAGLGQLRDRVALVVDVAPDGLHATAAAAAVRGDGVAVIDVVKAWDGAAAAAALVAALPDLVAKVRPRAVGWFPGGGAAAAAAALADRNRKGQARRIWPPRGVIVEELRTETPAVCMAFALDVTTGLIAHAGDPLLSAHALAAGKAWQGKVWAYTAQRSGAHADALYAAAGAVWLARTMPAPPPTPMVVTAD
jgi:hypothetical protein